LLASEQSSDEYPVGSSAYSIGNILGVISVSSIPVASVENADRVFRNDGERLEEADEAAFVIELAGWLVTEEFPRNVLDEDGVTLSSGREAMVIRAQLQSSMQPREPGS
jgi:hypothetical protein